MYLRTACLAAIALSSTVGIVSANIAADDEPVLRLRFQDKTPVKTPPVQLRPRFDAGITETSDPTPMPKVQLSQAGRVGSFAYVSTPHPNLVVAIGATNNVSEVGRQIDRAMTEMTRGDMLFKRQSDSSPFFGLGVRSGSPKQGWSAEATMGVGIHDTPEATRLSAEFTSAQTQAFETNAQAHFKLRYAF